MPTVHISADSPCDMTTELAYTNSVTLIPLYLHFGDGQAMRDGIEITGRDVVEHYEKSGKLPKTAAPSIGDYLSAWEPLIHDGGEVLHIAFSSGVSSACQTARIAALECGHVHVLDSKLLCGAYTLAVLHACELRSHEIGIAEIAVETAAFSKELHSAFLVEDITFLRAGGRCSAMEALGANLFKIRPSLTTLDGKLVPMGSYRGKMADIRQRFLKDMLTQYPVANNHKSAILEYTVLPQGDIAPLVEILEDSGHFSKIITCETGSVITAHCGKGMVALFF
ncbi:MAG: DegV family protein [Oscillospiraceae bacterium]|nr:DegV family protein [Oscillospiraceae bacterium]